MSRKVFTAGEVLAAADVNSFLMDQSIMSFAGTAARGSAIPSPVTGMYTHLEDSNPVPRLQFWNGSDWASPLGTTLLASNTFTTQSSVALDNIFTSEFRFYDIYLTGTGSTGTGLSAFLRSGSTDLSTSTYTSQQINVSGTTFGASSSSGTGWSIGTFRSAGPSFFNFTLANPFLVSETQLMMIGVDRTSPARMEQCANANTSVASYNGIRFAVSPGTISGQVTVYGRRS
jgi:hypothetical protein